MNTSIKVLSGLFVIVAAMAAAYPVSSAEPVVIAWKQCLHQPPAWYGTDEAARIATNILHYQRASGGWPKNIEMAAPLSTEALAQQRADKVKSDVTIDNGATHTQLRFLARVYAASPRMEWHEACLRGLDFLLQSQYANGGWPQQPLAQSGYPLHITFNDDAMAGVLTLLQSIARANADWSWVDATRRRRAAAAVSKGVECILKCQVVIDGRRTAWCAQHDEKTLAPAPARAYEKISLSGGESVGIVRFLMSLDRPSPGVVAAIEGAAAWFQQAALHGIKEVRQPAPGTPTGWDKVIVKDEKAGPLWARFYDIYSNRPIYCGRDGEVKYSIAGIDYERRNGYSWHTKAPTSLLEVDLPAWRQRLK